MYSRAAEISAANRKTKPRNNYCDGNYETRKNIQDAIIIIYAKYARQIDMFDKYAIFLLFQINT